MFDSYDEARKAGFTPEEIQEALRFEAAQNTIRRQVEIEAEALRARRYASLKRAMKESAEKNPIYRELLGWEQPTGEEPPKAVKLIVDYYRQRGHWPLTADDCAFLWACGIKAEEDIRQ